MTKERERVVNSAPCPDCPDGYVWNERGQTEAECPTCNGTAVVWKLGTKTCASLARKAGKKS